MSIDFFIVRHGIAHDPDPGEWPDDDERPLTKKGISAFEDAAKGLKKTRIDKVFSSSLVRAEQTAKILTEKAGWPAHQTIPQLRPEVAPAALIEALRSRISDGEAIALVGHEPQLSDVIRTLTGARVALKKGGVARIELDAHWNGGATLRWLLTQKLLS